MFDIVECVKKFNGDLQTELAKYAGLPAKVDKLENSVNLLSSRVTQLEARCTTIENRATAVENRCGDLETRATTIEAQLGKIPDENGTQTSIRINKATGKMQYLDNGNWIDIA